MDTQTRIQTYPGLYRSQAEAAFRADAAQAAAHGWYPVAQQWTGTDLVVSYAYGQRARWTAPPGAAIDPNPPQLMWGSPAPGVTGGMSTATRVVLGATGIGLATLAVMLLLGVGPFGPDRRTIPLGDIRPYAPDATAVLDGAWHIPYPETSCADWNSRMDAGQRWAMAGDLLAGYHADARLGAPNEIDIAAFALGITAACSNPEGDPSLDGFKVPDLASVLFMLLQEDELPPQA